MIDLVDTHCHIHEIDARDGQVHDRWLQGGERTPESIIGTAHQADVNRIITIGTTLKDSILAVDFVQNYQEVWASIGIHPHEAKEYTDYMLLAQFASLVDKPKVVAIGECGLDYHYNLSPKADQEKILRFQIELALENNLPISFHVRDAFDDFWPIIDSYGDVRGVLHSFTDSIENMEKAFERDLYVGVNGIATFSKDEESKEFYRTIPMSRILLETDAPYLTPNPYRGKVCESGHIRVTAEYLSALRDVSLAEIARITTENALKLFNLEDTYEK